MSAGSNPIRHLAIGWLVVACTLGSVQPVAAEAACATDADRLRSHLVQAERSSFRWNLSWSIVFGAAAAGQLVLAATETNPLGTFDQDSKETLYVGAAKATIGLASRLVFPLRVSLPAPLADRCEELSALRATVQGMAKKQRQVFWLTHLGGTALNLAGALVLWSRRSFSVGALSFLISYPVGITSAYTLPRKTWKLWRAEAPGWSVGVMPGRERTLFVMGRAF
jgi:hypothetical protein